MGEDEAIRYEAADGVGRITLARADKRNALTEAMFRELGDAAERAAEDATVRAVLVEAEGSSFCAGIDLATMAQLAGPVAERFPEFLALAQRPFRLLAEMPKPTVAAVQGHAIGAGFQLALACDLRVAAADATFAMLEARFGLIPDLGGMHHLVRSVGLALAKEIVWTTRPVGAREALAVGMVNRVVESSELAEASRALLDELLALAPVTQARTKELMGHATEVGLASELEREGEAQLACLRSDDHAEAVAALLERREPRFARPAEG